MVAPDKLTAYMNVYKNFDREKIHWMTEIDKHPGLNLVPLLKALRREIANGERDVYLPNDTHWGSAGMKIAAQSLYHYLLEKSIIQNQGQDIFSGTGQTDKP